MSGAPPRSPVMALYATDLRSSETRELATAERLLAGAKARVLRYARLEVGAGIEKKQDDFVAEVMAQAGVKK